MATGDLEIGSRVGNYQVLEILGAGGMGKVYKVKNLITDRVEAMKVLLPDLAQQPGLADRFLREIRVLASLQHPNIAALHTAECIGNQLVMLVEYLDGMTLDQKIGAGPLPPTEAVRNLSQVLAALEYAHARGVVHRDIKPANMLVTATGVVKLLDFGIARTEDHRLTKTGVTLGSLYYMSPEQVRAENLDARSDLYSVGVSLYEMVTGKHPFDGDSQYSIMSAHLKSEPVPPLQVNPALPAFLNEIILKSVAKERDARYQSAAEFVAALNQGATPTPAAAPRIEAQTGHFVKSATSPTVETAAAAPALAAASQTSALPPPATAASRKRTIWIAAGATLTAGVVIGLLQFGPKSGTSASPKAEPVSAPAQFAPPPSASPWPVPSTTPSSEPRRQVSQPAARQTPAPQSAATQAPAVTPTPAQQPPPSPAPAANTAELQQARDRLLTMEARAGGLHDSLEALKKSQAALGVGLRQDLQLSSGLMDRYLANAGTALKSGDLDAGRQALDKAEPEIRKLEQNFGK